MTAKSQLNARISDHTRTQLDALCAAMNETQTGVIAIAIDRMAQQEGMNTMEPIFRTPDGWGNEAIYANEETMNADIDNLRTLGEGWETIELADCDEYEFVKSYGNGQALYEQQHVRRPNFIVFTADGDGYYSPVYVAGHFGNPARFAQYFSIEDADEDFA